MPFMLMIRLQRIGRKNQPYFRFVLTESQNSTKSGKFHEVLGFFDFRKEGKHSINADKVKHWMSKGAQLSDTVHNYLVAEKIIEGKKKNVLPRKSPVKPAPTPEAGSESRPQSVGKENEKKEAPADTKAEEAETAPETPKEAPTVNEEKKEETAEVKA
jgi:small subunit ribosomal protein S16